MDRIAPLAKILAEANGIDWQKMQGSGAGGQIVEQDILNYLSRVMSGEEDPPDTPVDLPPPDWNGEEVPTADMLGRAGMSADMLSRAGVDTDLTAFVEQTRAAAPAQTEGSSSESLEEDALEFELEDEEPVHVAPVHTPEVAAPAFSMPAPEVTAAPSFEAPAPLMAGTPEPEPVDVTPSEPTPAEPAPVEPEPVAAAEQPVAAPVQPEMPAAAVAAPAAAGGLAAGLGSLLSRLYQKPADAPAPAPEPIPTPVTPAPVTPAPVNQAPATPDMPEVEAPAAAWTDGRQAADAAWAQPADEGTEPAVPTGTPAEAPVAEPEPVAAQAQERAEERAEDTSTEDTGTDDMVTGTPDVAAAAVEAEPEAAEPLTADPVAAELPAAEPVSAEPVAAEPVVAEPEPVAAQADVTAPQDTHTAAETPAVSEPEVAPVAAVAAPAAAMPSNGVWFGAYLRRDADVAALHDLRGQVTAALSRDLPLALLVARAAQRHADTLGLGSVAVHADGGALAAGSGSLRDALDAGAFTGTPDLLVVNAGAMDLDDLHFPHTTTLSVGRVQGGRAALTLNGDVDAARAAQFLAQVAGTLEQPILLVL
ncbi:E3 binding domain-containing protein [Deinococcus xianganensis]|uniref:Peripheral subunit-binding (PSBD) domain-containing protein n=1 Tax=Deinococcus xianganensis TaxID=1507289 RepID=A0A6I4YHB2_9DEIO|nr:E3 binding domain-containing protein [Deinococcus xianganensis]MXV19124.1 hypothetical protein [Deinococcus xianganensis]